MKYLLIIISLLSGLFLYLGFRSPGTPIYQWSLKLGFENELQVLRNFTQDIYLPGWIIYSVPDGLWMFAFVLSVFSVWNFELNSTSGKWIYAAILMGLGFEFMQAFVNGIGVFDWNDLFIMLISTAIALLMFSNNTVPKKPMKRNQVLKNNIWHPHKFLQEIKFNNNL